MATDRTEAAKRGQQRHSKRHPYFSLEWRILDSESYADLTFSARALLDVIGRQLGVPNNNGHLLAAYSFIRKFGFDSDRTVTRATNELLEHGFLFKTKTGGYQRGVGKFAVTWLPLSADLSGISATGFKACAWREWQPATEKLRPTNLRSSSRKNVGLTGSVPDNFAAAWSDKIADAVVVPVKEQKKPADYGAWISPYIARLAANGPQFSVSCSIADPTSLRRKNRQRRPLTSPNAIRLVANTDRGALRLVAA